ncbi:MAG: GNAT family N-acetyltransferase [Planctomycetota bacterium]
MAGRSDSSRAGDRADPGTLGEGPAGGLSPEGGRPGPAPPPEGLEFEFDLEGRRLEDFMRLYAETMDRRQASEFYRFRRSFFEALARDLRGRFAVASVRLRGGVVSCDLMLISGEDVWGFLLGTRAEALALHVNTYLRHETFLRCRELGKKRYILGGGYRPGDGILHFKRAFAPRGEVPFHVARRVYDAGRVAALVARRAAWERAQGRVWNPDPEYFPPYRA